MFETALHLITGITYLINDPLLLGAEALPFGRYRKSKSVNKDMYMDEVEENTNESSGFIYGLSNGSARVIFAFRF